MRSLTQVQSKQTSSFEPLQTGLLQRKCSSCGQHSVGSGECTKCQKKRSNLQRRPSNQNNAYPEVPSIVNEVLRSPGQPLSSNTRTQMESGFGRDFSHVRVHTDSKAAESAQAVNALAYTVGNSIVFGSGQYAPETSSGKRLLAHELTHTIQQSSSKNSIQSKTEISQPEDIAEQEAEAVSTKIVQGQQVSVRAKTSLIQRTIAPPGDCTHAEQRSLQNEVNKTCKGKSRRCSGNDDCAKLWQKIEANAECIRARSKINSRCFRGGDLGHNEAVKAAVGALGNCWTFYNRNCQNRKPPVPIPVPKDVPDNKPVVDKTFMEKMAAITGLTGTALVIYLIISEGSRLFPPRNLLPIP